MKVVLFCGGHGMRMRSGPADALPKPMQMVGPRPLLWHVMRYYAHHGHTEFVLCLGYGAESIVDYFLSYRERSGTDFVLDGGRSDVGRGDLDDWRITFAHTGLDAPIGERLRRVRHHLDGDEMFLANYADVLSDAPVNDMIDRVRREQVGAAMLVVRPQPSFHCVSFDEQDRIATIAPVADLALWENGGYFVLTPEIFDHLPPGGDLVTDGCGGLARRGRLLAHRHQGFWKPADTFKERAELEAAWAAGHRPWAPWSHDDGAAGPTAGTAAVVAHPAGGDPGDETLGLDLRSGAAAAAGSPAAAAAAVPTPPVAVAAAGSPEATPAVPAARTAYGSGTPSMTGGSPR